MKRRGEKHPAHTTLSKSRIIILRPTVFAVPPPNYTNTVSHKMVSLKTGKSRILAFVPIRNQYIVAFSSLFVIGLHMLLHLCPMTCLNS
jgi:hypothetical protein